MIKKGRGTTVIKRFFKKCGSISGKIAHKIAFRIKLWLMDEEWARRGGSCFELFPPSFYYTHTKEEIRAAADKQLRPIKEAIGLLDPKEPTKTEKKDTETDGTGIIKTEK